MKVKKANELRKDMWELRGEGAGEGGGVGENKGTEDKN